MAHLEYYNYPGWGETAKKDFKYSQSVKVGNQIHLSGQGGWTREGFEIPESLEAQIAQAFDNIEFTLRGAGGKGWSEVYKVRSYHLPMDADALKFMSENFRKYCPNHEPVWTAVGTPGLGDPRMKVEIEVEATRA